MILLLIIGAVGFIVTFDANDYKPFISEQVKAQTGRDLTLGDIKPSVFPWLGLELQQLSLSNAEGFKSEKMLKVERLDVRVELLPLIQQQVRIDTLRLHGLALFLEKNKSGKTNWADILEKQAAQRPEEVDVAKDTDESKADPLASLLINGVEVKDANINWDDASNGQQVELQKFNLNTGALHLGDPMPVSLSALIKLSEPAVSAQIEIQTSIEFDSQSQQLKLDALNVVMVAALQQDELKQLQLNLNTQLKADLKKQQFIMPAYSIDMALQGKGLPKGSMKARLQGDANIDLQKQTAKIKQLTLKSMGLKLQSQVSVSNLLSSPNVSGELNLETFNPAKLLNTLAIELPEMKNKDSMKNMALSFNYSVNEKALDIKSLEMKLDKSTVLATLGVRNFAKPEIHYSVELDQLVLDDYLPPASKQENVPVAAVKAKEDTPIELPVPLLRSLNINGVVNIKTLKAFDQSISRLKVNMLASGGLIKISELSAALLEGKVVSSAQLDVRKNTPRYQLKLTGNKLKADSIVNPLLQNMLAEKSVSMSGTAELRMNIKSAGQTVNQLIAGSNGQFSLNMGEAKLHDVDVEYFVRKGVADYAEEKAIPLAAGFRGKYKPEEKTALKVASVSAVIRNGVIESKDLLLDSSKYKITGAGKINLPQERLNYRPVLDMKVTNPKSTAEHLRDTPMPVFVKGNFAQPKISIDKKAWLRSVGKVLKTEAKKKAKEKVKTKKDELKDELKDKLFKGLFR